VLCVALDDELRCWTLLWNWLLPELHLFSLLGFFFFNLCGWVSGLEHGEGDDSCEIFILLGFIKHKDVAYLGGVCFRVSFVGQFLVPTWEDSKSTLVGHLRSVLLLCFCRSTVFLLYQVSKASVFPFMYPQVLIYLHTVIVGGFIIKKLSFAWVRDEFCRSYGRVYGTFLSIYKYVISEQ
jgi:hypothetical protein